MKADYIAAVLADSPAAFWELQDAADFPQDSSGNGKHMDSKSVGTSLTYRSAAFGPASAYCVALSKAALWRSTDTVITAVNNMTMEFWQGVSFTEVASQEVFFLGNVSGATDANSLGSNGWGVATNNAGHPFIRLFNGGTLHDSAAATGSWSASAGNSFKHFVVVRRAGTWELWINGVQDTGIGAFTFAPGAYGGVNQVAYIGQNDTGGRALSFSIAYAALYASALSSARILAHYNAMVSTWENADYPFNSRVSSGDGTEYHASGRIEIL